MRILVMVLYFLAAATEGAAARDEAPPEPHMNPLGYLRRSSNWGDSSGSWGSLRRRRTQLSSHVAASPTVSALVGDLDSAALEWPVEGYDRTTVNMVLFTDAMLFVAFVVVCVFIYHWSRPNTDSPDAMHGAKDSKYQKKEMEALKQSLPPPAEEECTSWGDHAAEPTPPPVTDIRVPPNKAHTPPAQAIASLQTELKRYKKQEDKTPAAWRRVKIQELEERLRGLASSQGWLSEGKELRASTMCNPCTGDVEEGEPEQVYPPGLKTCCMTYCGVCPCPYCQDTYGLQAAKKELQELQADLAVNREQVVALYRENKGLSEAGANAKIDEKVRAAEEKVKDEQAALNDKAQQKMGSAIGFCQTAVAAPCMVGLWSWPAFIGLGTAGAGAAGQNTFGGDLSLGITCVVFPLTLFSLYYKADQRRGLRPLLLYVPGGMMMLNYCVWNSIMEHEASQMYLFDSTRVKSFTKYLEVLGIILTMWSNLWNASVDKTLWDWLKKKGWVDWLEREQESPLRSCWTCSCFAKTPAEEADNTQDVQVEVGTVAPSEASARVAHEATKVKPAQKKTNKSWMKNMATDEWS